MNKGQISFDLILTIMVVLLFVAEVQLVTSQLQETQKNATVRNQEKAMALNIYSIMSTAKALDEDGAKVYLEYKTDALIAPETSGVVQQCEIDLETGVITYTRDGETIVSEILDFDAGNLTIINTTINCGEKIQVLK